MNELGFFGKEIIDLLGFFAEGADRAAGAGSVVEGAGVVVAELDEDGVAGFDLGEQLIPQALGDKRAAAAPTAGGVDDVDFCRVEIRGEWHAPAGGGGWAFGGRRVTGDEERGQGGVEGFGREGLGRGEGRRQRGVARIGGRVGRGEEG